MPCGISGCSCRPTTARPPRWRSGSCDTEEGVQDFLNGLTPAQAAAAKVVVRLLPPRQHLGYSTRTDYCVFYPEA